MDSTVGRFAVRSKALKVLHQKAVEQARHFKALHFVHVPRTANHVANALAAEAVQGRRFCTQGL